ncbi:MAG TPA: hypothetical protein VJR58_18530 [Vineibacter sp.]|nr:hypothetical protein [Vineibacter sp.]
MLIFFHLALRRMAQRQRHLRPEAAGPALVPVLRPAGPLVPLGQAADRRLGASPDGAPRAPRPYKRRNKGL